MASAPLVHANAQEFAYVGGFPIPMNSASMNNAPAANTAAVCTCAADADRVNVLTSVQWSYSAAPTGGSLQVESVSGTIVWGPHAITAAGLGSLRFDPPIMNTNKNEALIVTLAAPGGTVVGALSIQAHRIF
jgi:hypothetical protein